MFSGEDVTPDILHRDKTNVKGQLSPGSKVHTGGKPICYRSRGPVSDAQRKIRGEGCGVISPTLAESAVPPGRNRFVTRSAIWIFARPDVSDKSEKRSESAKRCEKVYLPTS